MKSQQKLILIAILLLNTIFIQAQFKKVDFDPTIKISQEERTINLVKPTNQESSLIYQQLFNGKIIVMLVSPHIEGYGQPKPPLSLEILRPDELKVPFIIRHMESFLKDITDWEDFDDDEPQKASSGFTPIGFNHPPVGQE